jgi:beta-galactosidase
VLKRFCKVAFAVSIMEPGPVSTLNRNLLVNGRPAFILCGEVHYFRLQRSEWEDRVLKAKAAGVQAIASYIPWIIHEEIEGEVDLTGRVQDENDLGGFIDLCKAHDLWFLARPGPFVMAEMKNEGIPFWVYERAPSACPETWKGAAITSRTLDYLDPHFLDLVARWYSQVIPVLASRQPSKGGNLIGVQLDNEVGMLSWVRNEPDLTPRILEELAASNPEVNWSDPSESESLAWREGYADFQRGRFLRYFEILDEAARKNGLTEAPFFINIHGTGGGRASTFPVGLSQLGGALADPRWVAGTDHYLGEITRENFPDLWFMDSFTLAASPGPLTSLEFEAGNGDYGDCGARRIDASAADIKAKVSAVRGCRLINAYLISGGRNRPLRKPVGDGNDRIAFTGERHGFAAPIDPEGSLGSTYAGLQKTFLCLGAAASVLAEAEEQLDDLALAYIPDAYTTDYRRPGPLDDLVRSLEGSRPSLENMTRGLLLAGFRPGAVNLQDDTQELPECLAVAGSRHMDAKVQRRIADHVITGGRLLLYGEPPVFDLRGRSCTLLLDSLGVSYGDRIEASGEFHLSAEGVAEMAGRPEFRMGWARILAGGEPLLRVVGTGSPCGVKVRAGTGQAVLLSCDHPSQSEGLSRACQILGVRRRLEILCQDSGVVGTWSRTPRNEAALVVVNLDHEEKEAVVRPTGEVAEWEGVPPLSLKLSGKEARLLLLNCRLEEVDLAWSTAELAQRSPGRLEFAGGESQVCARLPEDWSSSVQGEQEEGGWTLFQVQPHAPLVFSRQV